MMPNTLVAVAATTLLAVVIGSPRGTAADSSSLVLSERNWEAFAGSTGIGSFAWAGEDEGFSRRAQWFGSLGNGAVLDASEPDPALLTAIPAPEPPALVLAGLAFGGVLCGRSLVMKRRKSGGGADECESETPRA